MRQSGVNRPLALLVAATFFMEFLDGTILATAAPAIASDLGVQPVDVNAAMTGYLVALAAGIPITGWLTDRFGGRRILMIAIAVFTVSSFLCALSVSLPMLVAMRVLQGAGGALMVPVGRLVVLRATEKRDMLDAIAYLTWPALVAPVVAPTIGGWIVTVASWHWIFLINIPLGLIAFVVAARIVPTERAETVPPPDWIGFALCGGVLGALLIGLELVRPSVVGSGALLASAIVFVVLAGTATWWLRHTPHPVLRFDSLRVPSFRVSNSGGSTYRGVISAVPFVLPLMFQVGFGWSPIQAGLLVLLLFAGNVGIKPATTPLIRRFGFRTVLIGSLIAGGLILGVIATMRPTWPIVIIGAALVLSGAFRSIGFSAYNTLQFTDIEPAAVAEANTLSSTLQQVATALGVAIGALVLRLAGEIPALDGSPTAPYTVTFAVLALLMLHPLIEVLRLHRTAGESATRR